MGYRSHNRIAGKIGRKVRPFLNTRVLEFELTKPLVSFTFDDFPKSAIEVGARTLEKENWCGTFYTAMGLEGIDNHHGQHFSQQDLMDLDARGHEIACHSYSHKPINRQPLNAVYQDLDQNIERLNALGLKTPVRNFAYPLGECSADLKKKLESRYASMRGIFDGVHHGKCDLNELKSQALDQGKMQEKAISIINSLQDSPAWLILFTHDIIDDPSQWGCTPSEFTQIVKLVKAVGADVLPVGEAIDFLKQSPKA